MENNSPSYTIEIPDCIFNNLESQFHTQRDATRQETSPEVVADDALQEAIGSIGGIQYNENEE